jgi:CRP-like cAMP-binding protein
VILALLSPGGLFGITAAFDDGDQPAQAVTIERSTIARFNAAAFVRWTEGSAGARGALVRELTRQIRELSQKIGEHALMNTRDRLLSTLLEIADEEGEAEPGGTQISFTRPTHKELANRIGTSREVVSRLLAELRESDLLEADEGRVIRLPLSALVLRDD